MSINKIEIEYELLVYTINPEDSIIYLYVKKGDIIETYLDLLKKETGFTIIDVIDGNGNVEKFHINTSHITKIVERKSNATNLHLQGGYILC